MDVRFETWKLEKKKKSKMPGGRFGFIDDGLFKGLFEPI